MLRSCGVSCVWGCVEHGVLCASWRCWHTDSKGQTSPSLRGSRRWLCHVSVSLLREDASLETSSFATAKGKYLLGEETPGKVRG